MPRKPDSVLRVHLHGRHVADLTTRRGQLRLTYLPETIDELGVGGLCLSVALPVTLAPHAGARVLHWCEGLLPEGETRTTLEQRFEVQRGDTFGLLEALGRECAGAVTLLSDDTLVAAGEVSALSDDELAAAVAQLPQRPLGVDEDVRASLGGLQAKLLLVRTGSRWGSRSPARRALTCSSPTRANSRGLGSLWERRSPCGRRASPGWSPRRSSSLTSTAAPC